MVEASWRFDRTLPVAVFVALAVQAAGALLWAGRAEARMDDLKQQLDRQQPVAERLARLVEQVGGARAAIDRIEAKLDGREGRR
jgi:HAMP domain-containing protein